MRVHMCQGAWIGWDGVPAKMVGWRQIALQVCRCVSHSFHTDRGCEKPA
jgi:hypothetical protein